MTTVRLWWTAIGSNYALARAAADGIGEVQNVTNQVNTNTTNIADHEMRITANEGEIWNADGTSRIDANEDRSMRNAAEIWNADGTSRIDENADNIITNARNIMTNSGAIWDENGENRIAANRDFIEHNHEHILEHSALIESNQMSIMRNTEDIQTLKSGVAASMALAGMPEMGARGVSVGAGSYGGETALAVGVHFSGENARFKIGVTSSGGETGASLGAGWSF